MYIVNLALGPEKIDALHKRSEYHFNQGVDTNPRPLPYRTRTRIPAVQKAAAQIMGFEPPVARPKQANSEPRSPSRRHDKPGEVPLVRPTNGNPTLSGVITERHAVPGETSAPKRSQTHHNDTRGRSALCSSSPKTKDTSIPLWPRLVPGRFPGWVRKKT